MSEQSDKTTGNGTDQDRPDSAKTATDAVPVITTGLDPADAPLTTMDPSAVEEPDE